MSNLVTCRTRSPNEKYFIKNLLCKFVFDCCDYLHERFDWSISFLVAHIVYMKKHSEETLMSHIGFICHVITVTLYWFQSTPQRHCRPITSILWRNCTWDNKFLYLLPISAVHPFNRILEIHKWRCNNCTSKTSSNEILADTLLRFFKCLNLSLY